MTNNKPLTKKHIAILDDLKKWRNVAKDSLTHYGCNNITYFETKEDIITTYDPSSTKPDIVLIDINLNICDRNNKEGLEVCQFFKETSIKTTIVVMSSLENIADEAKKSGANFIIQKKNFVQDFDTFVKQYTSNQ